MQTKQKSLKINFIMNAVLTVSNIIFPIITFPYASRVLTPAGTGKVSAAVAFVAFFNLFAQLGIPTYGVKACARVRDNREELTRTAHELLMINLIMSFVMYVLLCFAILFFPVLKDEKVLYITVSATILLNSLGMEWLYKALEQYTYITVRSVIFKFIAMILMFVLIHSPKDYALYGLVSIIASSASYILNFINVRKYIDIKPVGGYNLLRHIKPVGIYLGMACATTIYTSLDRVMLRFMTDDTEVGLYDAAVKIKYVLQMLVTSLGAVLLPRVSYYLEKNEKEEFKRITAKALGFVFVFAGAVSVFFIVLSKQSVLLISGAMYSGAILPMQIIMPTVLLIGISNIFGIQMLIPLGREKDLLFAEIGGAVIDMAINFALINSLRSSGVAIGTMVAELFVTIYLFVILRKELRGMIDKTNLLKVMASLLVAFVVLMGALYLCRFISVDVIVPWIGKYIKEFRLAEELGYVKDLVLSFISFSLVYFGMLILLKEKMALEIVGMIKKKK